MDKKAAVDSTCIKCGKPADRRFSVESDHGFIFLCSSQECYNSLVNELRDLRNHQSLSNERLFFYYDKPQ